MREGERDRAGEERPPPGERGGVALISGGTGNPYFTTDSGAALRALELGADARMNSPGTSAGNWQWRMLPEAADKALAKKLKLYTTTYRR